MLAEKGISRDLCRQLLHSGRLLYGVPAIVFGVFAGLYSMFHFLLTAARTMDPTAPPPSDVPSSHKKEDDPHGTR